MAFTYTAGANPRIDIIRLMIDDTDPEWPVFEDLEIEMAYTIAGHVFQYGAGSQGALVPASAVSYWRVAAVLLDVMAINKSKLSSIKRVLDVTVDPKDAAAALRDRAKEYRQLDDESGAFAFIEMVNDPFSFQEQFYSSYMRSTA